MRTRGTAWFLGMVGALVVLGGSGCARSFQAQAKQPNPVTYPADTIRQSAKLKIYVGHQDIDAIKTIMENSASFVVVSRDRLRFHVTVEHKWEEYADVEGWTVWLEDEHGKRLEPEDKETIRNKNRSEFIDYDRRSTDRNQFGDITRVNNDGFKNRVTLRTLDRFRGEGDYTFYARSLIDRNTRGLSLVMKRGDLVYRYRWEFGDGPVMVENHKQGTLGLSGGYMAPGPVTGWR